MSNFLPTYLYIKQHSITKKCYFGKTTKKDPVKYLGSGKHWLPHIKLHGKEFVETLWFKLFTDKAECTRVALLFSEQQDIIKSELWLNQKFENGIDGALACNKNALGNKNKGPLGKKNALGHKHTTEFCARRSAEMIGNKNLSATHIKVICPHCKLEGDSNLMKRWHFDNCKRVLNKETQ